MPWKGGHFEAVTYALAVIANACLQLQWRNCIRRTFEPYLVNVNVSQLRCILLSNGNLHTYYIWHSQNWHFCSSDNTVLRVISVFKDETLVSVLLYNNITHTFKSDYRHSHQKQIIYYYMCAKVQFSLLVDLRVVWKLTLNTTASHSLCTGGSSPVIKLPECKAEVKN
jgi:hypothetical protein